jgi:hypothetical protein
MVHRSRQHVRRAPFAATIQTRCLDVITEVLELPLGLVVSAFLLLARAFGLLLGVVGCLAPLLLRLACGFLAPAFDFVSQSTVHGMILSSIPGLVVEMRLILIVGPAMLMPGISQRGGLAVRPDRRRYVTCISG